MSPLAVLPNLEALRISGALLDDISPLARLTGLEILDLCYNNITDTSPLTGLPESVDLRLDGNPAVARR
ncbi:MAG: leucine-rich repeat domain-containing protein [Oscillospiraceae bacterium]|nr:leucine-rich repeat domain-containing protein [Oscillospiraceae bacterium]